MKTKSFRRFLSAAAAVAVLAGLSAVSSIFASGNGSSVVKVDSIAFTENNIRKDATSDTQDTVLYTESLPALLPGAQAVRLSLKPGMYIKPGELGWAYTDSTMQKWNALYMGLKFDDGLDLEGVDGFVFYVKTEGDCNLLFALEDPKAFHVRQMKVGSEYQVLAAGDQEWQDKAAVASWQTKGGEWWGAIPFNDAFEGYIRIPKSVLLNDNGKGWAEFTCRQLNFNWDKLGSDSGNRPIIAPFLSKAEGSLTLPAPATSSSSSSNTTESSAATVPSENSPAKLTVPANAKEINRKDIQKINGDAYAVVKVEEFTLDGVDSPGIRMSAQRLTEGGATGGFVTDVNGDYARPGFVWKIYTGLDMYQELNDTVGMMFYVKVDSANRLAFDLELQMPDDKNRYNEQERPLMQLKTGTEYQYQEAGSQEWKTAKTVKGMTEDGTWASAFQFDKAFEGFIRIPYSAFANKTGFAIDPALDAAVRVIFHMDSIGGEYGSPIVGPLFTVDSMDDPSSVTSSISTPPTGEAGTAAGAVVLCTVSLAACGFAVRKVKKRG